MCKNMIGTWEELELYSYHEHESRELSYRSEWNNLLVSSPSASRALTPEAQMRLCSKLTTVQERRKPHITTTRSVVLLSSLVVCVRVLIQSTCVYTGCPRRWWPHADMYHPWSWGQVWLQCESKSLFLSLLQLSHNGYTHHTKPSLIFS